MQIYGFAPSSLICSGFFQYDLVIRTLTIDQVLGFNFISIFFGYFTYTVVQTVILVGNFGVGDLVIYGNEFVVAIPCIFNFSLVCGFAN